MSSFNLSNDINLNLLKEIIKYLSPRDICSLSQTSKFYHRITKQFDYKFKEESYKQFCSAYETFNIEITPQSNPKLLSFSLDILELKQERVIDDNALHGAGSGSGKGNGSLNVCWKELGNIGIFLKQAWKTYNKDTKHMDMIVIRDIVYDRLMESKSIPKIRKKNTIVETEFNSPLQKFLYDFLYEEQELYEEYNNLFVEMRFCGEMGLIKDSGKELPFNYFITDYALMKRMIKTDKDKEQLLYARWYYIIDKPEMNGAKGNKEKDKEKDKVMNAYNINNNNQDDMLMIDEKDSLKKNILFNFKEVKSSINNIHTTNDKAIVITIDLIKRQLTQESNPLFFLLKCLTMTLKFYCHYTMIYLQSSFSSSPHSISVSASASASQYNHHILLSEYLKRYKNFVETAISLNALFENANVAINSLYEFYYENHPSFPKFSVFRLCMLIWNEELTTPIEDNESMLSLIKMSFISLYNNTLHNDLDYYFANPSYLFTSNDNNNNVNQSHSKSSHSSTSYTLITNDPNVSANVNKESSACSNRDSTSQYIIIEQILSSIIDSFCNEYNVFTLNLFKITTSSTYEEIEGNILDTIENEITHYYQTKILASQCQYKGKGSGQQGQQGQGQSKTPFRRYVEDIINYFTSGFYSERIINQLRLKILSTIHQVFNNIVNNQIRKTFEDKMMTWNIQAINESQAKEYLMYNNNNNSFKSMQIYSLLLESLTMATPQSVSQIVREYIVLKYLLFITADKTCNLLTVKYIDDWFNEENVKILKKSKQVFKVIDKKEIPTEFDQSQMELLSLFKRPSIEAFTKEHSDIDVDMDIESGSGIGNGMEDVDMDYEKYMP